VLVNPVAGLGGPLGHKGSDDLLPAALSADASHAHQRMLQMLQHISAAQDRILFKSVTGLMGEQALAEAGLSGEYVWSPAVPSSAMDTCEAVRRLEQAGIDLLVFAPAPPSSR